MSKSETLGATRDVAIGHLRAFITLLVVFHHAVLPYQAGRPPLASSLEAQPMLWTAFPVIDASGWSGFDLVVGWDDVFFMSLMFFVSGLFAWPSLRKKGSSRFVRDRAWRLGVPFAASALVLAPLAYYPSFLQITHASGSAAGGFWSEWLSLPSWPAGPAWFLWVLLVLDGVSALLFRAAPRAGDALGHLAGKVERPIAFFAAMVTVGALVYLPMARVIEPLSWVSVGPFFLQASRAVLYAVWFFAGVGVGANGIGRGLLLPGGRLARRWWAWALASVVSFVVEIVLVVAIFGAIGKGAAPSRALLDGANLGFVISCASSCLALLAMFVRFARPRAFFDGLARNAYGMYLTHYVFVSWLAYALLPVLAPAVAKGTLVFIGAAALSWLAVSAARRVRAMLTRPSAMACTGTE